MQDDGLPGWPVAFALIYFTFFLDNVLLTVLVPIIPDWVGGSSLEAWTEHETPLAALLNSTVRHAPGAGASQAVVGAVLSAKALAQLAAAGPCAAAVGRAGPACVLRVGCALLLLAAAVFWACSGGGGWWAALAAGTARAAQGAGAAAAGVAGLALVAAAAPPAHRDRAIGALLGAVALGVLVGYPLGGAAAALWSRGAPFLLIGTALALDLALQYAFLDREEFNQVCAEETGAGAKGDGGGWGWAREAACGGNAGACAGAVLLTTSIMAALEPCLPIWIMDKFHPQVWVTGAVFVPDSAAYLAATSALGGAARALGVERVALAGQCAAAGAALALPHAKSVRALAAPHALLGAGLGALDAALVPALVSRGGRRAAARAALLQASSAAAYALGPCVGGALSWLAGFETALRSLAVANLLYAAYLYRTLARYPLSPQWGARSPEDEDAESSEERDTGLTHRYHTFH